MTQLRLSRKEVLKFILTFGVYTPKIEIDLSEINSGIIEKPMYTGHMIATPRRTGKTSHLIQIAENNPLNRYLVIVADSVRFHDFKRLIIDKNLKNVDVVTVSDFKSGFNPILRNREILVDDIEDVLSLIVNGRISVFTTSRENIKKVVSIKDYN